MLKCPVCSYIIEKGDAQGLIGQKVVCTSCLSEFEVTPEMVGGAPQKEPVKAGPGDSDIKKLAHKKYDGVGSYRFQGDKVQHVKDDIFGNIARSTTMRSKDGEKAGPDAGTRPKPLHTAKDDDDLVIQMDIHDPLSQSTTGTGHEEAQGPSFADSLFSDDSLSDDLPPIDLGGTIDQEPPASTTNQGGVLPDDLGFDLPDDMLTTGDTGKKDSGISGPLNMPPDDGIGGGLDGLQLDIADIPNHTTDETPHAEDKFSLDGLDLDLSDGLDLDMGDTAGPSQAEDDVLGLDNLGDTGGVPISGGPSLDVDMTGGGNLDIDMPPPPPGKALSNPPPPPGGGGFTSPAAPPPAPGAAPVPKVKARPRQGNLLKVVFLGSMLLIFIGIILGQTRYGYFGLNAIMGTKPKVSRTRLKMATSRINRSTTLIDSFQTLKSQLRVFTVNPGVLQKAKVPTKKKLLYLLANFQVRYPRAYKNDKSYTVLFNRLKNELHPSGKNWDIFLIEKNIVTGQLKAAKSKLDKVAPTLGDSAMKHYLYGRLAFATKNYVEAEKQLQLALLKQKRLTKAGYFLGMTYLKEKAYNKAASSFNNVIAQERNHIGAHLGYAWALFGRSDMAKAESIGGEYTQKARSLKDPDDEYFGHILMARIYGASGAKNKEIRHLRRIVFLQPDNQWAVFRLSRYLIEANKLQEAWRVLQTAKDKGVKSKNLYVLLLKTAFALGKQKAAKNLFNQAVKRFPKEPDFYILKGEYYWKKGLATTAAESFGKAVALDPTNPQVYVALGKVLLHQNRYTEAEKKLKEGLTKVPNPVAIQEELARVYLAMGAFQKAEQMLHQALQKEPDRVSAMKVLGKVLFELGSYSAAITLFQSLQKRGALDKKSSITYAKSLLKAGKYDDAENVLDRWYDLDKDDFVIAVQMARVYINEGKLKQAETLLKHVKKINPQYAPLYSAYGFLYFTRKQYAKSADMYLKATTLDTNSYPDRYLMARSLWMTHSVGNTKLALNQLNIITKAYTAGVVPRQKQDPAVYVLKGQIYFNLQKYQDALQNFDKALELAPERVDILLQAGKSLFNMARYKEASQYFRRVLAKDSQEPTANYYLGIISLRYNDMKSAARHFSTTIMRAGDTYPDAYRMLGMIYRDQGNDRLAMEQFKMYLKLAPANAPQRTEIQRLMSDYTNR